MRFGISSFALGWGIGFDGARPKHPLDELDLLRLAHKWGAKALQIADNLPLHTLSNDRLQALLQAANAAGIRLEVGARGLTKSNLELYAQIARELGSPFVRFVIDEVNYSPSLKEVRTIIQQSLPALEGVVLAIENHDRFSATDLRQLVESLDSPQVAICLDTANSLGAGEGLETVLRNLGPWVVNVHIKDIVIERIPTKMGFSVSGRPAGQGQIDIPALLGSLKTFGRCQSATLEQWTPAEPTLEETIAKELVWAEQSCDYLRPFFEL